jgi:putative oxidoreductase
VAPSKSSRPLDTGLAILRIAVGLNFALIHGLPKLFGGPDLWYEIGMMPGDMGTRIAPASFGFIAAVMESVGGTLLAMGYHTRITASILISVPLVATLTLLHLESGDWHYPALTAMTLLALAFTGPGHYSKDAKMRYEQLQLQRAIEAKKVLREQERQKQLFDSELYRSPSDSTPEAPQTPPLEPPTVPDAR